LAARLAPDKQRIFAVLRADELTHLDALVERLVAKLSSSQIFVRLFKLERSGRIRALPEEILRKRHLGVGSVISELRGSRASVVSVSTEIIIVGEQK